VTQLSGGACLRILLALGAGCSLVFAQPSAVPVILQQPQSRLASLGSNAVLDVVVDPATTNVRYQWRLNGGNIPGQTTPTLQIEEVQVGDAGTYSVAVYTDAGAIESDDAELQLAGLPIVSFSDLFAAGPLLSSVSGMVRGNNVGATGESGEPLHVGKLPRHSVWAMWTAPATPGIVTFKTVGSSFDTLLAVYAGNLLTQLSEVRGDDDDGGFLTSQVTFRTQPQTTYRIAIDGFGGAAGRFILSWNFESTTNSLPLFTSEPLEQAFAPGADAVFSVTTATNYSWQWYFNGQPLPNETTATLRVRNVSVTNVGLYFCRGFNGERFRDTRTVRLQINANEFGVADPASLSTEKLFDVRLLANDFAGTQKSARRKSVAHGFSGTQIFSTLGSTKEIGEPLHCGLVGGASEWFAYQAETNGLLCIDTEGSNFDTVLAVYTGPGDSFASLVSVACDNNSGLDGKDSRVSFPATAGTIYWIAVDGVNNPNNGQPAKGSVTLHYRMVLPLNFSAMSYTSEAGGKLSFRISGTPNLATTIEASTDLASASWLPLVTNTSASGVFNYTNMGVSAFSNRYYRAVNRF
jgi:hypothetical protein